MKMQTSTIKKVLGYSILLAVMVVSVIVGYMVAIPVLGTLFHHMIGFYTVMLVACGIAYIVGTGLISIIKMIKL